MEPGGEYKYPYKREKGSRDNPEFDRYTLSGGSAEGTLIGGNISVLDSMIGTRFEPDFKNKIAYGRYRGKDIQDRQDGFPFAVGNQPETGCRHCDGCIRGV